jgi:hypothetical protein
MCPFHADLIFEQCVEQFLKGDPRRELGSSVRLSNIVAGYTSVAHAIDYNGVVGFD